MSVSACYCYYVCCYSYRVFFTIYVRIIWTAAGQTNLDTFSNFCILLLIVIDIILICFFINVWMYISYKWLNCQINRWRRIVGCKGRTLYNLNEKYNITTVNKWIIKKKYSQDNNINIVFVHGGIMAWIQSEHSYCFSTIQ